MKPLVAILPKNHGSEVPLQFRQQCEKVIVKFENHLRASEIPYDVVENAVSVIQSFTWFMMDSREMAGPPATREELVMRFLAWYHKNIKNEWLTEAEIESHMDVFFAFVEKERISAMPI